MAQSRQITKVKESIRVKSATLLSKDDSGCDTCPEELETDSQQPDTDTETQVSEGTKQKTPGKARGVSSIKLRSNNKSKQDIQLLPDVGGTGTSPTIHSNMKTKQAKEDQDKSLDEDTIVEPKTRARKKASDVNDDDKKTSQDEPKTSKDTKKTINKPKTIVKKRPLGIRKTLRGKKTVPVKEKVKNVIKQTVTRGRKAARRTEPVNSQDKETVPLIPASEIKKEPVDDTSPSRSCSPKTAGRRQRLSSDMIMMKSMLGDSPSSLVLGPRTSPYSMRSERSNSPSLFDGKNLRSGKPRKVKSNLLNEVVKKEQKKRRRLLSDSKNSDTAEGSEDCKKPKRGRSCSRDGSEISKCSDNTESDLSEALNDTDSKELNKKLDKSKTDLDVDIENNVQISTIEKVPSLNVDSKLSETKPDAETSCIINEKKKNKLSLKRSTSLDSDNNNSNRVKLENLNSSDIEDKLLLKTENNTLLEARSSILTSMSKTFNSKEVSKNMRKARRGRKAAAAGRPAPVTSTSGVGTPAPVTSPTVTIAVATVPSPATSTPVAKNCITNDPADDKIETLETLSKEIDDLINNLDQNIDHDHAMAAETNLITETSPEMQTKSVSKFYSLAKPLNNGASITNVSPETPVKDRSEIITITSESTPSKNEDSENIRLHYEEDSVEKSDGVKHEITYKCSTVASIDKLMDRLKEFEELDKRRQRQESESKSNDSSKGMMVTNDVVLITKSGADIKPLKDIQSVRSPEKTFEKENVLSCFENNSAISIVKRDHVRKSIDVDLPNSVTLIKRNSFSSRKESTSSNHSKESDAISIFEKSLGKDVTLTEIRKSVDKSATSNQVDLHPFATLHPNNPTQSLGGVVLDSCQISITPRVMSEPKLNNNDMQKLTKRKSQESLSRKSSESTNEEEKMATLEKIKSPPHQTMSPAISITPTPVAVKTPEMNPPPASIKSPEIIPQPISVKSPEVIPPPVAVKSPEIVSTPVAIKSPEAAPVETEALPPPTENVKSIPQDIPVASEIPKVDSAKITEPETKVGIPDIENTKIVETTLKIEEKTETPVAENFPEIESEKVEKMVVGEKSKSDEKIEEIPKKTEVSEERSESIESKPPEKDGKPEKVPVKPVKSARNSIESQPGTSNMLNETPESQKRKENVLRTLGLLTHKAAKEAKIEKLKEKERIYLMSNKTKGAKSGSADYTGTLKTVIKLNRGTGDREKKKHRSSLKMTFQKSKYRSGKPTPEVGEPGTEDAAYYTIERREGIAGATSDGGQRKSHYSNRLNNYVGTLVSTDPEAAPEPAEPKEILNLVIPEKASSFSIHPGRLCQDQCFYCGGKFGLFDTPCHIAQIKSSERQKKVLDNEEKLTIDSCLCDACYRHVDRRANCPSYRKRPIIKQPDVPVLPSTSPLNINEVPQSEKPPSPPLEEESEEEPQTGGAPSAAPGRVATCHTEACVAPADHSIRRKWLIKMRSSVNKVLKLKGDYPGLHTIPLCGVHWRALAPLAACALCTRRLHKHHNMHIVQHGYTELNPHLSAAGLPVQFTERPVLCKACRYYCTLLQRHNFNDSYARGYRRKLLQIYNIEVPPLSDNEHEESATAEDGSANTSATKKKKQRTKSKQRKSSDPDKPDSESSEKTNESTPEKEQLKEEIEKQPLEEDIESLISSNKILVPGAVKPNETTGQSDGSETEMICDVETPLLHLDKQTELQYLLQKQNNPAQFMQKPANLTQKQKNILKLQTISGIQKPGQQHRINEKNAKRLHKLGQIFAHNEKVVRKDELEIFDDKSRDGIPILKNISLNDECTIESIPNKRPADINTLKNKWQMSESFTQVKKNLSELSKKLTVEKEPKKLSDQKYSNPVRRLETNPSISVRELFPGEEEMNLQCNIEFNNVKGVTPEGWEKCNTLIQYDVETRKLWNELQRPYGNQSSFLRHLILLEKYFRSGDLVLSHNATPHAANYSDSVQSRLRAYDNVVNDTPRRSEPAISLIEYRKKPSINGKSLLKSNQNETDKDSKKFMPPPMFPKPKAKSSEKSKSKPLPPELIAINTPNAQGRKAIQNVLHNIQQLVKGVSASDPTEVAAAPLPLPKYEPAKEKKEAPKADTPKKIKTTSKPWRPTLMPITQENLARIGREPTQVAVDGRNLPSLVQVMSSGKRYHITLQDYNKMCIMRREKLQQLHDSDKKRPSTEDNTVVTEIQPSTMLGNGGTLVQNITVDEKTDKKDMPELGQIGSNAATILKNVGLKNITIAPIPAKTATITSQTVPSPVVSSPSLLVTSTPIKIPQLGPAVSITSETIMTPNLPIMTSHMIMPKIPKSLTVIPQTVMAAAPQNVMVAATVAPPQGVATGAVGAATDGPRP